MLQGLFGNKGKSTKQISLKTIMNTKIPVILEILPDSFGIDKKILKESKDVHMEVKALQALLLRRRRITLNKESSRKGMKNKLMSNDSFVAF